MDFALSEDQCMIAETVQAFFAEQATSARTRDAIASDGFDRALWESFCTELGLAGAFFPEAYGGVGLGMIEFATMAEAAGAQVAAIPLLGLAMAGLALTAGGSEDLCGQWLPRLIAGERIAAFARSAALREEDGKLSGTAEFVPHGGIADLFVIASGDKAWLVPADATGLAVQTFTTMDQTRPLASLTFDAVAADPLPDGAAAGEAARRAGLLCLAAEAVGGAQGAIDRTVAYSLERKQFGRAIGSFQAYKHRLADRVVDLEQARSAMYWAACTIDEASDEAALALHAAKSFCADTFFACAADMIQLHGGIGFTWEHDAHLFFKRARSIQTLLGSGDTHREAIAALMLGEAA